MKSKLSAALAAVFFALCGVVSPAYSQLSGFLYSNGSYTAINDPSGTNTLAFGIPKPSASTIQGRLSACIETRPVLRITVSCTTLAPTLP